MKNKKLSNPFQLPEFQKWLNRKLKELKQYYNEPDCADVNDLTLQFAQHQKNHNTLLRNLK